MSRQYSSDLHGVPAESSTSTIIRPSPKPTLIPSFLPDITQRMSQLFEKAEPASPPSDAEVSPAPPPSPDQPLTVDSPRSASSEHDHRIVKKKSAGSSSSRSRTKYRGQDNLLRRRSAPFLKKLKPTLVLENSGSVARDHLALERTFLAYVRTSLAIASMGVALVQLFTISNTSSSPTAPPKRIQVYARPLGATTVCFGIVVLVIGITRYFTVQNALTKGMFPVARVTVTGISIALVVIVVVVFGILVTGRR